MTEKVLQVILTSLSIPPGIFPQGIMNSKKTIKLLFNENGTRYQKNNCRFEIRALD